MGVARLANHKRPTKGLSIMRIIGGRDYYDTAGYGVDTDITFVREEVELDAGRQISLIDMRGSYGSPRMSALMGSEGVVVLAGKAYPFMALPDPDKIADLPPGYFGVRSFASLARLNGGADKHFYDADSALATAERLGALAFRKNPRFYGKSERLRMKGHIAEHFAARDADSVMRWAIEQRAAVAIFRPDQRDDRSHRNTVNVKINGAGLAGIEFWKILPAAEAHMELSNFVGGVLPRDNSPMVKLSDTHRILKAGMSPVTSFRNMPRS